MLVQNPHNDPMWREHLDWMLENHPQRVEQLFQNGQLKEYLDRKTGQAMLRISKLVKKGQSQQEARDLVRET